MERVRRALKRAKLEKYVQAFEETGYDDWHEILAMEEQALEALVTRVRFSANHADRFRGVVARARERKRIDDDEDVWCDNEIFITSNQPDCPTESRQLCTSGFERYMIWRASLPSGD